MAELSVSTRIGAPADRVWSLIGDFNGLPRWHPEVEKSELQEDGKVRQLSIAGGGQVRERLERRDDEARELSYTIVEGALPATDYLSTIRVTPEPDGANCTVEWHSEFEPAGVSASQACETIRNIYLAGLENLKTLFRQ